MEILRHAHPTESKEHTGITQIPELIRFSTNLPGRFIDPTIESIDFGVFAQELHKIKNEAKKDKEDKVGVYYVDGHNLMLGNNDSYFSGNKKSDTIKVEIDEPNVNPDNPSKYLPKEKSIGAIIHFSQAQPLPMPDNLLHLLLEDKHFKAATAAFFLTSKDHLFAIFRSKTTPQANINRARKIVSNMKDVQKQFYWSNSGNGITMKTANMCVLREALREYGLQFYYGNLKSGKLIKSIPELHHFK